MRARIYRPTKNAMQSGTRNTRDWVLEYEPGEQKRHDPLMGWISSGDTRAQVRLRFSSKEEALAFAEKHGLDFVVQKPKHRRIKPKAYAENFAYTRAGLWTH